MFLVGTEANQSELTNSFFRELRDRLFPVAADDGTIMRTTYDGMERPAEAEFDSRQRNFFKPFWAVSSCPRCLLRSWSGFYVDRALDNVVPIVHCVLSIC
jgi:hypothetical protein